MPRALGQASPAISAIGAGKGAAYKIFEVIKRVPDIDITDSRGAIPDKVKGDVELREVDFRYPTRPDVLVLSKFSLSIPAGKTVALVGESGSGKSTVVSLIERFYDPESGAVLLDGMDIKTIQLKWLRQQIGLVSQEPVLFSTSVRENIAYGKEDATIEEIENAAVLANASKFIARIPQVSLNCTSMLQPTNSKAWHCCKLINARRQGSWNFRAKLLASSYDNQHECKFGTITFPCCTYCLVINECFCCVVL